MSQCIQTLNVSFLKAGLATVGFLLGLVNVSLDPAGIAAEAGDLDLLLGRVKVAVLIGLETDDGLEGLGTLPEEEGLLNEARWVGMCLAEGLSLARSPLLIGLLGFSGVVPWALFDGILGGLMIRATPPLRGVRFGISGLGLGSVPPPEELLLLEGGLNVMKLDPPLGAGIVVRESPGITT